MPVSEFAWIGKSDGEDLSKMKEAIKTYSFDDSHGAILEVSLHYPSSLHRRDRSYPLLQRNTTITFDELTDFQKDGVKNQYPGQYENKSYKAQRLIPSLKSQKRYVTHIAHLQWLCAKGIKIKKVS